MKKRASKRILKMVTVLCAAMFLFGSATTVSAAVDLVGRGTAATTSSTSGSSSKSSSATNSTTSSTTNSSTNSGNIASKSQTPVTPNNAILSKVGTTVQTGVVEKIMPFLIGIGMAFAAMMMFAHLQMNQVRYGKSEKYYKELLDFLCACKL